MKRLNKHPRIFKKVANTLKKLIQKQIKLVRSKMINVKNNGGNKNNIKNTSNNKNFHNNYKQNKIVVNNVNEQNDFSKIISISSFRKIPYETFILKLIPYDMETYIFMIKNKYTPKVLITVNNFKSIHFILKILNDKWKNITKNNPKIILYLIPNKEFWIGHKLIYFSLNENKIAFDIGDIYTSYGCPQTNELCMKYQWTEQIIKFPNDIEKDIDIQNDYIDNNIQNDNFIINKNLNNQNINYDNKTLSINDKKNEIKNNLDIIKEEDDDYLSEDNYNSDESCPLLESDLNMFDPLEFLGIDVEKKNNEFKNSIRTPSISKKFYGKKKRKLTFVNNVDSKNKILNNQFISNNSNIDNKNKTENNDTLKSLKSNSHLRTGYNEVFSQNYQNENNLNLTYDNLNNNHLSYLSSHNNIDKNTKNIHTKKKIPFINNVTESEYKQLEKINKERQNEYLNQKEKEEIKNENSKLNPFKSKESSPLKKYFTNNNNSIFNFQKSIFPQSNNLSQILNHENTMNINMNTRLNLDNDYFNSNNGFKTIFESNLLKSDYGNSNFYRNDLSKFSNSHFLNNQNYSNITNSNNIKVNEEQFIGKKKNRNKKKNKKDDNDNKKKFDDKKKNIKEIFNNNSNNIGININNQNHIFNSYPSNMFPQLPKNIDVPYPSQFIEK